LRGGGPRGKKRHLRGSVRRSSANGTFGGGKKNNQPKKNKNKNKKKKNKKTNPKKKNQKKKRLIGKGGYLRNPNYSFGLPQIKGLYFWTDPSHHPSKNPSTG